MTVETLTRAALATLWDTHGVTGDSLRVDADGTLGGQPSLALRETVASWIETGPTASQATVVGAQGEAAAILGEGAMGVVVLIDQPTLRRQVAVKRLKAGVASAQTADALRREARLVGNLEHPNIVAVHDLIEVGGAPQMMMKRIEGVSWSRLLRDPVAARDYAKQSDIDLLLFHLRILIKVCHALRFAHAQGVLHLDIKPDNVMVGRFDEVYLVDWGIAAGFGKTQTAPRPWLTHVDTIRTVCGTPSYMAPEQVTAEGHTLGPHTDVFLLGAVLHEVVTGRRLHHGPDVITTLAAAWVAAPASYGPEVPAELVALIHRATTRAHADRLQTVDAFLAGVTAFLDHRVSTQLSDGATTRWRAAVDAGGSTVDRTLAECRFRYRQALSIWEDNDEARDGLQGLLVTLIDRALADGRVDQARNYLGELVLPAPDVKARVSAKEDALAQAQVEARTLERQMDQRVFMGPRSLAALLTGITWLIPNLGLGVLHRSGVMSVEVVSLFGLAAAAFAAYLMGAVPFRKTLLRTKFNRIPILLLGGGILTSALLWWMALNLGLDVYETLTLSLLFYPNFLLSVAVTIDLRVAWAVIPTLVGAVFAVRFPEYVFDIVGVIGLTTGLILARLWRPRGTPVTLSEWGRDG